MNARISLLSLSILCLSSCSFPPPEPFESDYWEYPYFSCRLGYFEAPSIQAFPILSESEAPSILDMEWEIIISFPCGSFVDEFDFGIEFSLSYIPFGEEASYSSSFVSPVSFGDAISCSEEEFEQGEPNPIDFGLGRSLCFPYACLRNPGELRVTATVFDKVDGAVAFRVVSLGAVGYSNGFAVEVAFATPFLDYRDPSLVSLY